MVNESCKKWADLNKNDAKKIHDIEVLIEKSIENCALNAAEWREILRRFKQEKDVLTQETKDKLLEVAIKTGWNRIAYNLDHDYRKKTFSSQKAQTPELKKIEVSSLEAEKIQKETLSTQSNVEFLTQMLQSELHQMTNAKRWDSISFWNGTDKKAKKEVYDQIISLLQNIKNNTPLTSADVKKALISELSTSEWGSVFNKNREEIKKHVLSFFVGDEFVKDIKQKSVKKIRENLWTDELKSLFKTEIGSEYKVGMSVPDDKKWLVKEYEAAFDPKNEWGKVSDESANQAKSFLAYDVTSMVASWLGTWALLKWGTSLAMKSARLATVADKVNTAGKTTKAVSAIASAWVEWTTFTALHEGIRNQEWFLNQKDGVKKIITNSLMFGTFKLANNLPANFLNSIKTKNPTLWASLDGLYKQWLVAPALYTAGIAGYESMTQTEQKSYQAWLKEFVLVWIVWGTFHLTGVGTTKAIEWLGTKAKLDTKTWELSVQTAQGNEVIVPLAKPEVEKIVPPKVEKVTPKEFSFSSQEVKNLESHGIIIKDGKLELKWFWDLYGHFLWGKNLADFVSVQIKNTSKDNIRLTVVDKKWITTIVDITAKKWEMEKIVIKDSQGKVFDFTTSKWEKKVDNSNENISSDEWVDAEFLKSIWKIEKEPPVVLKEQKLVPKETLQKMSDFWLSVKGEKLEFTTSTWALSLLTGEINLNEFSSFVIQSQTPTKMILEWVYTATNQKWMMTLHKKWDQIIRAEFQNFWPPAQTRIFDLEIPVFQPSSLSNAEAHKENLTKISQSISQAFPEKAPEVITKNTTQKPEPVDINSQKDTTVSPSEKKVEPVQKTSLSEFFQWAKVNENNQFKLILMQWPKGNIRVDFGFKGEIKWWFVMMNGESTIFTVSKGTFTFKPDNGKITQEDLINLIKIHKPSFTQ